MTPLRSRISSVWLRIRQGLSAASGAVRFRGGAQQPEGGSTAAAIGSEAAVLARRARFAGLDKLGFLLEMAVMEARSPEGHSTWEKK